MLKIELKNARTSNNALISSVYINGTFYCVSLENAQLQIPRSSYNITTTYSPKFHCIMPLILGVPNRSGIRIHSANYPNQLRGCIAFGDLGEDNMCIKNSRERTSHITNLICEALDNHELVKIILN